MKQIVKGAQRFSRRVVEYDDAKAELVGEPFKLELITDQRQVADQRPRGDGGRRR